MKNLYKLSIFFLILLLCACNTVKREPVHELTVSLTSPNVSIGEIEMQFDTSFMGIGGLKRESVTAFYYPREDAVCLQYRQNHFTYNQFWDRSSRLTFIKALHDYNIDYDARNLSRSERRAEKKYGTVRGFLIWQQYAFTLQARGNLDMELGYYFKNRAPYFAITQNGAEYIDEMARDNDRTSQIIIMYFTRAQAAELAAIFDPLFLTQFGSLQETGSLNFFEPHIDNHIPADEWD